MIEVLSYYTLLLLIVIFCFYMLFINLKSTPKKIKSYLNLFLIIAIAKNLFLIILSISGGRINLALSKAIVCLDLIYVPAIIITMFFIYWRSDKHSYKAVINKIWLVIPIYILVFFLLKSKFNISFDFGYSVGFVRDGLFRIVNISLMLVLMCIVVFSKSNSSTNNRGLAIILISIIVIVLENIAIVVLKNYLPYCLISEFILLISLEYSLKTFKS